MQHVKDLVLVAIAFLLVMVGALTVTEHCSNLAPYEDFTSTKFRAWNKFSKEMFTVHDTNRIVATDHFLAIGQDTLWGELQPGKRKFITSVPNGKGGDFVTLSKDKVIVHWNGKAMFSYTK